MKRYFNLTFTALSRGLDRFKTQLGAPSHPVEAQTPQHGEAPPLSPPEAAQTINTPNTAINSGINSGLNSGLNSGIDSEIDTDQFVSGVRYLQNYSPVKLQEIVSRVMAEVSSGQDELKLLEAAKQQDKDYQTWWLHDLIVKCADSPPTPATATDDNLDASKQLMLELFTFFKNLTTEFNSIIAQIPELSNLRVSTTEISTVKEKSGASYFRCRTSSASWSINLRGSASTIEIFLVPSAEIFLLSQAETSMRLKHVLRLNQIQGKEVWSIDSLTADSDELFYLVRTLFKQLLLATVQEAQDDMPGAAGILQNLEGEELRDAVSQIILAEQNMAQKIVSQQEEIQNRIARDLHDAIIADIMSLKRLLSGDKPLKNTEVVENLDQICTRLREICHDLAPRDLKDWGLQTVIEDLVERLAHRTGADCSFTCDGELPELPYPVQLHIYRIVQESLNNMEKYAKASKIIVRFEIDGKDIRITMKDNGQGFSPNAEGELRSKKEGGTGLSGIKERTEMIRCFFKTHLSVTSTPGEGSETVLEVKT